MQQSFLPPNLLDHHQIQLIHAASQIKQSLAGSGKEIALGNSPLEGASKTLLSLLSAQNMVNNATPSKTTATRFFHLVCICILHIQGIHMS